MDNFRDWIGFEFVIDENRTWRVVRRYQADWWQARTDSGVVRSWWYSGAELAEIERQQLVNVNPEAAYFAELCCTE